MKIFCIKSKIYTAPLKIKYECDIMRAIKDCSEGKFMNIKWDANKYTKDFSFVHKYGNDLIQMIDIREKMSVLDLGCGNGALTKKLCDMGLNAIGLDSSEDLLKIARELYPNIKFIKADATDFSLKTKMDAVFSNAVFHWIDKRKQSKMLDCVYKSLNDGGQFIFEFGGYGNNALIHTALQNEFQARNLIYKLPFYFPTIGEYSQLLEKAGFKIVYATLFERNTELSGKDGLADWIKMFIKSPFEKVDGKIKNEIICSVVERLSKELYLDKKWYADYVRIRFKAIKE